MIFFFKLKSKEPSGYTQQYLENSMHASSFEIKKKNGFVYLDRNRKIAFRGIFAILFPKIIVRMKITPNEICYLFRLHWFSSMILISSVIVGVGQFFIDAEKYPRDFPPYLPYIALLWYSIFLVVEFKKVKRDLINY